MHRTARVFRKNMNNMHKQRVTPGMNFLFSIVGLLLIFGAPPSCAASPDTTIVLENFEAEAEGGLPAAWRFFSRSNRRFEAPDRLMNASGRFVVMQEDGNNFLRAYTSGSARRISLPGEAFHWDLSSLPRLQWMWRAHRLPEGAREDRVNDSGAAVYVSFAKTDWLGRPRSIKYVYSTGLPPESVVSTGNVKIVVVSSGLQETGEWVHVARNVADDYRNIFGSEPPAPVSITLWSDSDNTDSVAEVDFDNIMFASSP